MLWLACQAACAAAAAADPPAPAEPAAATRVNTAAEPAGARPASFSGAIGPTFGVSPDYSGAAGHRVRVGIGYHLRYGRLSAGNTGGFVTRPSGEVTRGLGLDFGSDDSWRASVSLGVDNGRRARVSSQLAGTDNVRGTVRLRANVARPVGGGWKVGASVNTDVAGRGGGQGIDFSVGHDRSLGAGLTWSVGAGVSAASAGAMRSWYGVSEAAARRSGYPVYTPGAGWRSALLSTGVRAAIDAQWLAFWEVSASRLLGQAAASPLTHSVQSWRTSAGVAWRF